MVPQIRIIIIIPSILNLKDSPRQIGAKIALKMMVMQLVELTSIMLMYFTHTRGGELEFEMGGLTGIHDHGQR